MFANTLLYLLAFLESIFVFITPFFKTLKPPRSFLLETSLVSFPGAIELKRPLLCGQGFWYRIDHGTEAQSFWEMHNWGNRSRRHQKFPSVS